MKWRKKLWKMFPRRKKLDIYCTIVLCGTVQTLKEEFNKMIDAHLRSDGFGCYYNLRHIEYNGIIDNKRVKRIFKLITPNQYNHLFGMLIHNYWTIGPFAVPGYNKTETIIRNSISSTKAAGKVNDELRDA